MLGANRRWQDNANSGGKKSYLTQEQTMNYVLSSFREEIMFRAVVEEAAALASISLFLGMIAIWAQVLSTL
jgi:hypothetical protein